MEFQSRRKARFAVIFDVLKLRWEYRPLGFSTSGNWYRPDFSLPHARLLVEVGLEPMSSLRVEKIEELRTMAGLHNWQVRVLVENPLPVSAAELDDALFRQLKLEGFYGYRDLEIRAVQVALDCARKVDFADSHLYTMVSNARRDVENIESEARERLRSTGGRHVPGSAVA